MRVTGNLTVKAGLILRVWLGGLGLQVNGTHIRRFTPNRFTVSQLTTNKSWARRVLNCPTHKTVRLLCFGKHVTDPYLCSAGIT